MFCVVGACAFWIVPLLPWKRVESYLGNGVTVLEQIQGRQGYYKQKGGRGLSVLVQEMRPQVPWVVMCFKLHIVGTVLSNIASVLEIWWQEAGTLVLLCCSKNSFPFFWHGLCHSLPPVLGTSWKCFNKNGTQRRNDKVSDFNLKWENTRCFVLSEVSREEKQLAAATDLATDTC